MNATVIYMVTPVATHPDPDSIHSIRQESVIHSTFFLTEYCQTNSDRKDCTCSTMECTLQTHCSIQSVSAVFFCNSMFTHCTCTPGLYIPFNSRDINCSPNCKVNAASNANTLPVYCRCTPVQAGKYSFFRVMIRGGSRFWGGGVEIGFWRFSIVCRIISHL